MNIHIEGFPVQLAIEESHSIKSMHIGYPLRSLTVSFTVPVAMRGAVIALREAACADPTSTLSADNHSVWFAVNEPIYLVDDEDQISTWRLLSNSECWEEGDETARFEWDLQNLDDLQSTPR